MGETVVISRPRNENIYMINEAEYNALQKAKRALIYHALAVPAFLCPAMLRPGLCSLVAGLSFLRSFYLDPAILYIDSSRYR